MTFWSSPFRKSWKSTIFTETKQNPVYNKSLWSKLFKGTPLFWHASYHFMKGRISDGKSKYRKVTRVFYDSFNTWRICVQFESIENIFRTQKKWTLMFEQKNKYGNVHSRLCSNSWQISRSKTPWQVAEKKVFEIIIYRLYSS